MTNKDPNRWGLYFEGESEPIIEVVIMKPCPVPRIIAIDPGHGDRWRGNRYVDRGAESVCKSYVESDIALDIAMYVQNTLNIALGDDFPIIITRTEEVEVEERFKWRLDKAKTAEIFVSVHINSSPNTKSNGFEVIYKSGNEKSRLLAQSIQNANTLFTDNGIKEAGRGDVINPRVLRDFNGVAVLVEAGFIRNTSDLEIMTTKQAQIGREIANGIIKYLEGKI